MVNGEPQVASARILGGVGAVAHDGSLIDVPSSTQRRLLGILALEAPRSVRPERLASLLGVTAGAVRTTVARLRSSVGANALGRTANGYALTCDVDAECFCNAVARASRSTAPSPVLHEALALWGGAPLEEFADEVWARGEVLRLIELHDGAIDDLAELLIEARRPVDAVALLQRQVDGRPFRDRSHGLLIRALALGGRQSYALRSYQSYRSTLVNVGTRPSLGVIEIERRVAAGWDGVEGIAPESAVASTLTDARLTRCGADDRWVTAVQRRRRRGTAAGIQRAEPNSGGTEMVTVMVQHVCKDYGAWRPVFDEHATSRSGHGCTSERVYRDVEDPNAVAVVMEWPSTDAAQGFMSDPSLADAMQRGGVVGPPTVTIGEHVEPG